jgi:hypothetical protein
MKTMLMALAVFVVTVVPSFAADMQTSDTGSMRETMHPEHGAKMGMRHDPQFLLMMAYHRNLVTFALSLDKIAHQAPTVPREYAQTAISEMRHSTEQLEKYRAGFVSGMPAGTDHGDMKKMMDEHLVKVKIQLRELDELAKQDVIPSQEVIKRLQAILEGCEGMDCGMGHEKGDYCGEMHGKRSMPGCGCSEMTPERRKMMSDMVQQIKTEDAELTKLVDLMNQAPQDNKLNLLAGIVTRMVQQRAAMTAHMEKMMQKHMRHQGEPSMSPQMMNNEDEDTDNDDEDVDSDDMSDDTPGMNE